MNDLLIQVVFFIGEYPFSGSVCYTAEFHSTTVSFSFSVRRQRNRRGIITDGPTRYVAAESAAVDVRWDEEEEIESETGNDADYRVENVFAADKHNSR